MELSREAIVTVAKGLDWRDASRGQFRRAIELVKSGKARLTDAGLAVKVASQSVANKSYRFPSDGPCSCMQAQEGHICVHRIAADLLAVQDFLDAEAQAQAHDAMLAAAGGDLYDGQWQY